MGSRITSSASRAIGWAGVSSPRSTRCSSGTAPATSPPRSRLIAASNGAGRVGAAVRPSNRVSPARRAGRGIRSPSVSTARMPLRASRCRRRSGGTTRTPSSTTCMISPLSTASSRSLASSAPSSRVHSDQSSAPNPLVRSSARVSRSGSVRNASSKRVAAKSPRSMASTVHSSASGSTRLDCAARSVHERGPPAGLGRDTRRALEAEGVSADLAERLGDLVEAQRELGCGHDLHFAG